jgi:ubiquinone/menaquinone biosynthesis C-methylase UbiE
VGAATRIWRIPVLIARERRAGGARARVPEPMIMDDPAAVAAFDEAGATIASLIAAYDLAARALDALLPAHGRMVDLGSGSGVFLEFFATRRPDVTITGIDLSAPMRETARERFKRARLTGRVEIIAGDVTALPELGDRVDLVSSLNMLHQLPDEQVLRGALEEVARVRAAYGSAVALVDLARLRRNDTLQGLLAVFDPAMSELARRDALASEAAAFTVPELRAQLAAAGLGDLRSAYAKPFALRQLHWAPKPGATPAASAEWVHVPLPPEAARVARMQRWTGLPEAMRAAGSRS